MFVSASVGLMVSFPPSSEISISPSGMFFMTATSFSQKTVVAPGTMVFTLILDTKLIFPSVALTVSKSPLFSKYTLLVIEREFFCVEKLIAYSISCLKVWHHP